MHLHRFSKYLESRSAGFLFFLQFFSFCGILVNISTSAFHQVKSDGASQLIFYVTNFKSTAVPHIDNFQHIIWPSDILFTWMKIRGYLLNLSTGFWIDLFMLHWLVWQRCNYKFNSKSLQLQFTVASLSIHTCTTLPSSVQPDLKKNCWIKTLLPHWFMISICLCLHLDLHYAAKIEFY